MQRITDLFLLDVGRYTADQLTVYDEVLSVLIDNIGVAARTNLAQRLAPIDAAPMKAIRALALDSEIKVAEPILSQSNALDDENSWPLCCDKRAATSFGNCHAQYT